MNNLKLFLSMLIQLGSRLKKQLKMINEFC